ncbi:MAG: glucosaminidase domain-containing protein [Acidimicrobiia bacterium]
MSFTTVALVAVAVGACTPVKPPAGSCTQFWRGYVLASDHNYAGLGAFSGSDSYMCKDTPTQGVRAQLQHLRNYADAGSTPDTLGNPFEPRVKYDEAAFMSFPFKGDAPRWIDLNGKWAVPGGTYAQHIFEIYNGMRAHAGKGSVQPTMNIRGPSDLSAAQIASYVNSIGNPWRPEILPIQMAQLYIDEGNAVGVRGDIAFCQSILETGWFSWPGSYAGAEVGTADATNAPYFELRDGTTSRN